MNAPELSDYLKAAEGITAINPKHQRLVTKLAQAHRRVDFHVDMASNAAGLAEQTDGDYWKQGFAKAERKHLRAEEKWFDRVYELEAELPKREVENVAKCLIANLAAIEESKREGSTIRVEVPCVRMTDEVKAVLPENFRIDSVGGGTIIIKGHDHLWWTAEGYVIPRLRSALPRATVEAS